MQEHVSNTHDSFEAARAQAADYLGFTASERIVTPKGDAFEIPNPSLLDDDQLARYDQLQLEVESWDREDDELDDDGKLIRRGALKEPNRKNGVLVENYNIQLAKAIFGDRYEAFKAAGGRAVDVNLVWQKMGRELAERRKADPKSNRGDQAVEAVPDAD
ncbi:MULTISPECIES: hypothetical protein [Mycobacterium]|uniref:Tail assembly chaperone n=2 Tax=Mycobacterium TaxID=1763 RepID=A0A2G5PRI8_MYCCE|nr:MULTISPECIES: hypothetical protein [Mycobacterium]MCV7232762.1 hypothetical protein [Mycobacterium branderi]ORA40900.1 hypothetical protein BST20_01765 [Mycobacterium branderi]PIB80564.1 hypothetical protein CQY23_03215 [Mycobacterium celatum]BBZ09860.1 hypothetical protein MBRA_00550 [Mycobacterium branderi]